MTRSTIVGEEKRVRKNSSLLARVRIVPPSVHPGACTVLDSDRLHSVGTNTVQVRPVFI